MSLFRSIRNKLLLVVLLTTFLALAVAGGFILLYDMNSYRVIRENDMITQIRLLAYSSIPALQFEDPEVATQNLDLLRLRPSVRAAALYDARGELFTTYSRGAASTLFPAGPGAADLHTLDQSMFIFEPITENGEFLGTAYLQADYLLRDRVLDFFGVLGLVTLGSMSAAVLVSLWLQRFITRPLLSVASIARDVVNRKDFTRRAQKESEDEVGVLVDAFNDMLEEIQARTQALESSNLYLEQEVKERKRAREEVLRLNEELKHKVEELKEADRRKDDFLATLAHELRNPLAPIRSGIDALRSGLDSSTDKTQVYAILERQTQQLIRLVDDLMDVSRITRGKISLQREIIPLQDLLQAATEATRDLMEQKQQHFKLQLPAETVLLDVDPVRLTQVFLNLLSNAAHYTHEGGEIALSAELREGRLQVHIRDNGIGMSHDMLERVFDAFIQIENPLTKTKSGLGIGLTLARSLMQLHGGSIHAQSAGQGQGSCFTVELPLAQLDGPAPLAPRPAARPTQDKRRILVVDDNEDAARTLALLLELKGYELRVVFDGYAALEEGARFRPDIVLMDIGMPGMSGLDTARAARAQDWGRDSTLVAITGWGRDAHRAQTRAAGFDLHLVKPITLENIEALLAGQVQGSDGA